MSNGQFSHPCTRPAAWTEPKNEYGNRYVRCSAFGITGDREVRSSSTRRIAGTLTALRLQEANCDRPECAAELAATSARGPDRDGRHDREDSDHRDRSGEQAAQGQGHDG